MSWEWINVKMACQSSRSPRSPEDWIVMSKMLDMRLVLVLKEVNLETFQNIWNSELKECFAKLLYREITLYIWAYNVLSDHTTLLKKKPCLNQHKPLLLSVGLWTIFTWSDQLDDQANPTEHQFGLVGRWV